VNWRPRVVVAGTKFGRVYLSAFRSPDFDFELAGILALGSERSRACAARYSTPLFTDPAQIPAGVDIACVVVGSAVNGGHGREVAEALMARGIHVLQEHPLHADELAQCLRQARRCGVAYRLNTHYIHLKPVRLFIAAAQALLRRQRPLFIDAACALQTVYTLLDIIGKAVGGLRPWAFGEPSRLTDPAGGPSGARRPFRSLDGLIAGVPLAVRIQNQLEPSEPDNHAYCFHRITIGAEGGNITLLNTHGPVVWCPRAHMPSETKTTVCLEDLPGAHLDYPTAASLGPCEAPTYRHILQAIWPDGVRRALSGMRQAIVNREPAAQCGQYYLTLSRIWQELMARLGPFELLEKMTPEILSANELMADVLAVNPDWPRNGLDSGEARPDVLTLPDRGKRV
jgi:pyochelin biosynthetic protein PchG